MPAFSASAPLSRRPTQPLGDALAAVRRERGMTQVQLAAAAGITQPLLSDYERGRLRISAEMALRLASALHVPVERILSLAAAPAELPGQPAPRRRILRRLEQIERLPRRQQTAILQALDLMLRQAER